ncbi:MAG: hypothetical protein JW727_01670 [Candidatus Aenigmarchaeota archaeon]|nr:hypothetical protein [Candidatus Aenigmarchaeota archaeon]
MGKSLNLIREGANWENILKEIILEEGLEPWNLDALSISEALFRRIEVLEREGSVDVSRMKVIVERLRDSR